MTTTAKAVTAAVADNMEIAMGDISLAGDLVVPAGASGIVLFAHGSGSSRNSPRNKYVARMIRDAGVGTLLFDLLTPQEEFIDARTAQLRFDIPFLANRLIAATEWLANIPQAKDMAIGYFGASTGAGAALAAAAKLGKKISAIVSRGGRPDLAGDALPFVTAPTLLIVGGFDHRVIELNQWALAELRCEKRLEIVSGASHLFEEPGTLAEVGHLAADWFAKQFSNNGEH